MTTNMVDQRVLITGGSGFVGNRIVRHVREKYPNYNITILDTKPPPASPQGSDLKAAFVTGDITSLPSLQAIFAKVRPTVVIHTAGISPNLEERYRRRIEALVFRINAQGTKNIIQASQDVGTVKALLYTSSCTVVTDDWSREYANIDERWPTVQRGKSTIYAESKAAAETAVLAANSSDDALEKGQGFRTCALRPAIVFGEGDYALIPSVVSCIIDKNESPFRLGEGINMWDTVYVGNVADAHVLAMENLLSSNPSAAGEAFFIQNNEPVSCRDLMLQIWKEFNGHIPPYQIGVPIHLAWMVGYLAEWYSWFTGKGISLSRGSVVDATAMRYASGAKARELLGYEPRVSLEEGLRRSCKDYAMRLAEKETLSRGG